MCRIHKRDFPLSQDRIHIIHIQEREGLFFIIITLARYRQGKELKHYHEEFLKIIFSIKF